MMAWGVMSVISIINLLLLAGGVFVMVLLIKVLIKANRALDIWLYRNGAE